MTAGSLAWNCYRPRLGRDAPDGASATDCPVRLFGMGQMPPSLVQVIRASDRPCIRDMSCFETLRW